MISKDEKVVNVISVNIVVDGGVNDIRKDGADGDGEIGCDNAGGGDYSYEDGVIDLKLR